MPILSGGVVILTYVFGKHFYDKRVGLLAACLLSIFPIFREHAVLTFMEPISALLLLCAFWAFLSYKTLWTIIFGSLAMLGKIDNIIIFESTLFLIYLFQWVRKSEHKFNRHFLLSMCLPFIMVGPWLYLTYFLYSRNVFGMGIPSIRFFTHVFPITVEQLFVMHISITSITLFVIALIVIMGIRKQPQPHKMVGDLLGVWVLTALFVELIYLASPSASNNPRGIILALPALWILGANGLLSIRLRMRKILLSFLVAIFLLSNSAGIIYQIVQSDINHRTFPLWETMRFEPKGFVLTEYYWDCILYARQPATWFFADTRFKENILLHLKNFIPYITHNPIKYIILPKDTNLLADEIQSMNWVHLYQHFPFGRVLPTEVDAQTSDDVRLYLEVNYPQKIVGDFVIFTIK